MTISSPEGSSSIFTSRKVTPRCFRNDFVRQQSGHQLVLYMVMGSISSGFPNDPNDWMRAAEGGRRQCLVRDKRMLHDPETSALRLLVATWMRISARCSATLARSQSIFGSLDAKRFSARASAEKRLDRKSTRLNSSH